MIFSAYDKNYDCFAEAETLDALFTKLLDIWATPDKNFTTPVVQHIETNADCLKDAVQIDQHQVREFRMNLGYLIATAREDYHNEASYEGNKPVSHEGR